MSEDEFRRRLDRIDEEVTDLKNSQKVIVSKIATMETNDAVATVHRENVERRLDAIENTLQKLAWLIISAIILAGMTWIIGGGFTLGGN